MRVDLLGVLLCLAATTAEQVNGRVTEPWRPHPGAQIPYEFVLETLDGSYTLDPDNGVGLPLIFHAYLPEDAALRYMWNPANKATILKFLDDLPAETNVLFISYGLDSLRDMSTMREALSAALESQGKNKTEVDARLSQFHFSKVPMSGVSDKGANFLPNLMGQWPSARAVVKTHDIGLSERLIERLDTAYDWIPWPPPSGSFRVIPFGNGCTDPVPFDAASGVALVVREQATPCSFAEIISRAQAAGASGLLVSAVKGQDVLQMRCEGEECSVPVHIFATMIPYEAALELQEAAFQAAATQNRRVEVAFGEDSGPGYFAAIDATGRLQEVGWVKFPTLQHLSWAAQWLAYAEQLRKKLQEPALVVPIFEDEIMRGEHGISKEVSIPSEAELLQYGKVELDFKLDCPGTLDADCPIWDHVVQLFVCCDDDEDCEACDVTPWMHQHHPDDAAEIEWQAKFARGKLAAPERACGRELGRWVTPFRRRIGRWLTDVTPLRRLFSSQKCRFTAQTAPWALPWKPSLLLRFSQPEKKDSRNEEPIKLQPLFTGGTFDRGYNSLRHPLNITTPKGTNRALLYVVVTGHGSDENNCAEFCPTSHHFSVNNKELVVNFTEAGTPWGCTEHVLEGGEPNEHGTWQYGRGGWCDGANVQPLVFDISDSVSPEGQATQIAYRGLFRGRDPDPRKAPGYIMLQSSIAFFGRAAGVAEA